MRAISATYRAVHRQVREASGQARFEHLDELRGFAALAVVLFHVGTRVGAPALVANGYLAVDFFFMLSGFVVAHSYEARLTAGDARARRRMSWRAFALRRLVRLMPMATLGAALGGAYLLSRYWVAPGRSDPLAQLLAANLLNLFALPKLWIARATHGELFPANGPLWSLFFEIAMNLAWAAVLVGRTTRTLGVVAMLGAALTAFVAMRAGTLDIGWELGSFAGGIGRVTYGFTVGVLVQRWLGARPFALPVPRWLTVAVLLAVLIVPSQDLRWTLAVEFVILPPLLVAAAGLADRRGGALGTWLGRVSYPLYATHVPFLALTAGMLKSRGLAAHPGFLPYILVLPLLAVAWAIATRFDEPLRAALARRLFARG